jgi:hypothetical protein
MNFADTSYGFWRVTQSVAVLWLLMLAQGASSEEQPNTPTDDAPLEEVIVSALEPRYVAPTLRDRIGRVWVPVYINDRGPFRLVLDTGASHSAVMAPVAQALNLTPDINAKMMLRAATGSAVVPSIKVESLRAGELLLTGKRLPIIANALGGAEGVLGMEGLADKRIYIDFHSDLIVINKSHNERAPPGFITLPVKFERGKLLVVKARFGGLPVKAIIDTGGQATIANLATRAALARRFRNIPTQDRIIGATEESMMGEGYSPPPLEMGDIEIHNSHLTFADLEIFKVWKMTDEPVILVGMDALGLLDTLIIDYQRAELQLRVARR